MARGDYVEVTYRTGVGVTTREIEAESIGSSISWLEPRKTDDFLLIEVRSRSGETVERHMFARTDVVAISDGHHEPIARKAARK